MSQQQQTVLHDLIEGQTVYNNVVFEPVNKRALNFVFQQPLTNITFHNCIFDRLNLSRTTIDNCLFDHCVFNYSYINKNNNYINGTSFNCCVFNEGRVHKNESDTMFYNCEFKCAIFYHYPDLDN